MDIDLNKRFLMLGISSSIILTPALALADDDRDDDRDDDHSDDDRDDSDNDRGESRSDERNDDHSDDDRGDRDESHSNDRDDDRDDDHSDDDYSRSDDDREDDHSDDYEDDDSLDEILSDDGKLRDLQNQLNNGNLTQQEKERIQNILNDAREKFGIDDSVEKMIREENARELSSDIERSLIRNGWE